MTRILVSYALFLHYLERLLQKSSELSVKSAVTRLGFSCTIVQDGEYLLHTLDCMQLTCNYCDQHRNMT